MQKNYLILVKFILKKEKLVKLNIFMHAHMKC